MKRLSVRRYLLGWSRYALYAGCAGISLFLLASSYESIYNRPLPFIHTIGVVRLDSLAQDYNLPAALNAKPAVYGEFGKPVTLTIPLSAGSQHLSIVAPIYNHGQWLARSATMHLLTPTNPINGNIGTVILYCRAGFRTVNAGFLPAAGSNVFMDTESSWRYVYKVITAKAYASSYRYIPLADTNQGKLIIFCNDAAHGANDIIEADVLSVQGVTQ